MADGLLIWGIAAGFLVVLLSTAGALIVSNVIQVSRECTVNKECTTTQYCGSDFRCHEYPAIQETVVKTDYVKPALILGVAIVVGAVILKRNKKK